MASHRYLGHNAKYKNKHSRECLREYLAQCEDEVLQEVVQENVEKGYTMYKTTLKVKLPTVEGYARFLGFNRDTLFAWASVIPEFRIALDEIASRQKQVLIENGLQGSYNATIAKLILSNNHGMREKTDVTTDDLPIGSNFTDEQINRIADRVARRQIGDAGTPITEKSN